jgi:isoleucyl-tRNA synthetase
VQYLAGLCENSDLVPRVLISDAGLDEEERYILSRMQHITNQVRAASDDYNLPLIPKLVESLYLETSRTYIQLVREKSNGDEKQIVVDTLFTVLRRALTLAAPIAPFINEVLWQDLNQLVSQRGSVHEESWPAKSETFIDLSLEEDFTTLQEIITAGLRAREKLKTGVRWPIGEAVILHAERDLGRYEGILKRHLNVKKIAWNHPELQTARVMKPNFGEIAKTFGRDTKKVADLIEKQNPSPGVNLEGFEIRAQHLVPSYAVVPGFEAGSFSNGAIYLSARFSEDLLEEGYVRELTRAVQQLRKELGLQKRDAINLHISGTHTISAHHLEDLLRKCNATLVDRHVGEQRHEHIRERTYAISAQKTI